MSGQLRIEDARTAFLPLYGEDVFDLAVASGSAAAVLTPAPDPRLAPDWLVRGSLVAQDRPAGGILGSQTVFYGWLLERAGATGQFVVAIRGTGDLKEWFLDFEGTELTPHSVAGRVEYGFWSIFRSMRFRSPNGTEMPAAAGIAQVVGAGRVTVTGHSLGSALGTYLAFDLGSPAILGSRVEAVVFASPRPGDSSFAAAFNLVVPAHRAYWWVHDLVPRVPCGFGYQAVPGSIELSEPPGIHFCKTPPCAHHALTYSRLIDPTAVTTFRRIPHDQKYLACLGLV